VFGPYRLDRGGGRLVCGDANVPLRRKAFAVLEYLSARPGRLVSSEELLDALWPATHVTPSALAGCIHELRRALGDDARVPRFIETAYGRGYRFVAPAAGGGDATSVPAPARAGSGRGGDVQLAALARWFAWAVARVAKSTAGTRRREARLPAGRPPRHGRRRPPRRRRRRAR